MSLNVYKSSAGSGKTYTLVKEYLLLVLKDPNKFKEILAITFTNKAAAEMKSRILHYLTKICSDSNSKTIKNLLEDLKNSSGLADDTLKQRAEKVLGLLIHNYSDFAIGTIDSFAHKIVRTFSYDLFLPVNFEIEMDSSNMLSQSVDLLINNVGIDKELTNVFIEYTESKADEENNWNIERDLNLFSSTLFNEDSIIYIEKLKYHTIKEFVEIKSNIIKSVREFENYICNEASIADKLIKENNISHSAFYQKGKGVGIYFENLKKRKFDKIKPNNYVYSAFNEDKWFSKEATVEEIAALEKIKPLLIKAFVNLESYSEKYLKKYLLNKLIIKKIYALTLLNEIKKTLEILKKNSNIVFINDFNRQIANIVLNEPVPYIYERIGEKYKNYFIDEFQDTSILQWQNILPLIENSLSQNGFNLIVGDVKQAIYRFRSGEVEQFAQLPSIYGIEKTNLLLERENTLKRNYQENYLQNNFRSKTEIVNFNNSFFEIIKEIMPESVKSLYCKHEQKAKAENMGGLVSIDFLLKTNDISETYENVTNNKILAIVTSLIADNFHYNDIAILCRSNKNAANIARFLIKNNINIVSSESLLINSSPEVLFIISCLRYLNNSDDLISVFAIINFIRCNPRYKKGEEIENMTSSNTNKQKIFDFLNQLLKINEIDFNRNRLIKIVIYELCEELIRIFKLNDSKDPYLIAFLDNIFKFSNKKSTNISDFLDWWDKECERLSIVTPEGNNAVQISTIHKAKGLEFPVVIYPYAKGQIKNTKTSTWVDLESENIENLPATLVSINKDLNQTNFGYLYKDEFEKSILDVINLLYVVFTRPSERLYILSELPDNKSRKSDENSNNHEISKILSFYLNKIGIYDESKTNYIFGKEEKHLSDISNSLTKVLYSDSIISDNIKNKVFIKSVFDKTSLSCHFEENILWGNIFHSILSKIYSTEDIEKTVNDFFTYELYPIKFKDIIIDKIEKLLSNDFIKPYFTKGLKVLNEPELISDNGKIIRPDRIIFNGNSIVIIDYKTGKLKESHKTQLNEYANVLKSMNYQIDKKIIININSEMIQEIE